MCLLFIPIFTEISERDRSVKQETEEQEPSLIPTMASALTFCRPHLFVYLAECLIFNT